jgi:hypothetical protein
VPDVAQTVNALGERALLGAEIPFVCLDRAYRAQIQPEGIASKLDAASTFATGGMWGCLG